MHGTFETAVSPGHNVSTRDASIDLAKIAAVFAVIILHTASRVLGNAEFAEHSWWTANLVDSAVRWCVPVFVMASGATLLTRKTATEPLEDFYGRRLKKILIPLIFWTAAFLFWDASKAVIAGRDIPVATEMALKVASGLPYYHLWYLYMIVGLYCAAPFLARVAKNLNHTGLRNLAAAWLVLAAAVSIYSAMIPSPPVPFVFWFLNYVGYFVAGRWIYEKRLPLSTKVSVAMIALLSALTAGGTYLLSERGENNLYFYDYLSVTVIPASILAFSSFRASKIPDVPLLAKAAASSFGVYLVHPILLEIVWRVVGEQSAGLLQIAFVAILVFALSLGFSLAVLSVPYLRRVV